MDGWYNIIHQLHALSESTANTYYLQMGVRSVPRTYARTYLHMRHIGQHSRNAASFTGKNLYMSMSAYSMITPTLTTNSVKPHITIMWPAFSLRKIKELLLTYSAPRSSYVPMYVQVLSGACRVRSHVAWNVHPPL